MHTRMLTATHVHRITRTRAVSLLSVILLLLCPRNHAPQVDGYAIHPPNRRSTSAQSLSFALPSPKATGKHGTCKTDRRAQKRGVTQDRGCQPSRLFRVSPFNDFKRLSACTPSISLTDFLCAFTFSSSAMYDSPSRKRSSRTANLRSLRFTSMRLAGSKCRN